MLKGAWSAVLGLLNKFGITHRDLEVALIDAGLEDHAMALAREAKEYWESIAPVFDPVKDKRSTPGIDNPEDYKNAIKIEVREGKGFLPLITVENDLLPLAAWLEYGTVKMEEGAYCQKVVDHFGGGDVKIG